MKNYLFMAVAAIAALSSCSSDNDLTTGETGKKALTFTATMEGSATRATYDSGNKCAKWEEGDKISVNGKTYSAQDAGLTTTFKAATEGQEAEGPTYKAYFACTYDGETATLPAAVTETWADGKFNMPMYATSTKTELEFKNLCGVLKIIVKSDQIAAVKSIKVSSATKAVSGAFTVDANNAAVLTDADNVANTLTVTYTDAVTTTPEGKVFYVAVPAQTYQKLKIKLSADGTSYTKSMTTKSETDITVNRNKIYPITFADNAPITTGTATRIGGIYVNWVQLWENGPKFAEYNVGAEKVSDYGGLYSWGGSIDCDGSNACKGGSDPLSGTDDTATKLWGANWRMPKQDELGALVTNCNVVITDNYKNTGRKGVIYTGKGDYEANSIFLPDAGFFLSGTGIISRDNSGYYVSSSPSGTNTGTNNAYYLATHNSKNPLQPGARTNGRSVRAVLIDQRVDSESCETPGLNEENKIVF